MRWPSHLIEEKLECKEERVRDLGHMLCSRSCLVVRKRFMHTTLVMDFPRLDRGLIAVALGSLERRGPLPFIKWALVLV